MLSAELTRSAYGFLAFGVTGPSIELRLLAAKGTLDPRSQAVALRLYFAVSVLMFCVITIIECCRHAGRKHFTASTITTL